jgi:CO dehydrogenase nickel-insertion accessory protein CooC1
VQREQDDGRDVMVEDERTLAGERIGVFGKGGSGKTTTSVLMAKVLRKQGYDVCVLDADSTNIGLYKTLGIDHPPDSLIDYYGGMVFSGGTVTCPVDDPTPLIDAEVSLDQLTTRFYAKTPEGITYLSAGKIAGMGPGAGCDGPINKIARDFRLLSDRKSMVTLVDFKAGFEDSARGAIFVEIAQKIFREAEVKGVLIVLNRVRDDEMESYLRERLSDGGIEPVGVIHEDPALTISCLKGTPLKGVKLMSEAESIIRALEISKERLAS